MSDLTSIVDVWKGWPNGSALSASYKQKAGLGSDIVEGTIVDLENEAGVAVYDTMTSARMQADTAAVANEDDPWLLIQGKDQWDGSTSNRGTLIKLRTGVIFKVPTALEHNVGDMVYSNAGVVTSQVHATLAIAGGGGVYYTTDRFPIGQVIEFNSYENWVVVAS